MSKKIGIRLVNKDELEFELLEDAQKGDTFSLKDLDKIDFKSIYKKIDEKADEIYNVKLKEKEREFYEKFLHSDAYISLENQVKQLKYEKQKDKENYEKSFKLEIENKTTELNSKIALLQKDLQASQAKNLSDLKNKENELKVIYESQILKLTHESEKREIEYKQKIDEIERKRNQNNTKVLGNELEQWILNEYNNNFGVHDDCSLEKTNKSIDGTKPDFLFKVFDVEDKSILGTVTIEAKSQVSTSNTTLKNETHYDKLELDRKKNGSEFSLLISELEPNESFIIKKINDPNYQNMFVVRPSYFLVFLSIIRFIYLKQKLIKTAEMNFKTKQEILTEFNDLKNEILTRSIKNIDNNLAEIIKSSETIKKEAQKIDEAANIALNKHLNTIKNKIESFKINSITSKIEKIDN